MVCLVCRKQCLTLQCHISHWWCVWHADRNVLAYSAISHARLTEMSCLTVPHLTLVACGMLTELALQCHISHWWCDWLADNNVSPYSVASHTFVGVSSILTGMSTLTLDGAGLKLSWCPGCLDSGTAAP